MKIVIASDHAGFTLKKAILDWLIQEKIKFDDLGVDGPRSVDYPDYALQVAETVSKGKADAGILVCGTGIGMAIAANKFKGVRAASVNDVY